MPKINLPAVAILLSLRALSACESEATTPANIGVVGQATVNASSVSDFKYFNFANGAEVSVAAPLNDQSWDIALRRYEVRLDGGVAGTKGVSGALLLDNSALAAATILGFTPESQLAAFNAVSESDIPAASSFTTTDLAETESAWFQPAGATLVANANAAWKVRRADGGYAVMRVAQIGITGFSLSSFRLEYRLQPTGGTLGSLQSIDVSPGTSAAPSHISLATGSVVQSSGCTWDLAINSDLGFTVNSDASCHAGTFPLETTENFTSLTSAADAPSYGVFIATLSGPIPNGFTATMKPPFLYNIDTVNPNRLSPTFNVYLLEVGSAVYKIQFLSYYNPTGGESGYITFRYARIR